MLTEEEYQEFCELFMYEDYSVVECQEALGLTEEEMEWVIDRLGQDGYITLHTIH